MEICTKKALNEAIDITTPFHVLKVMKHQYKHLDKFINEVGKVRFGRMKEKCSPYTFLPVNEFMAFCCGNQSDKFSGKSYQQYLMDNSPDLYREGISLGVIAAWNYTKQIYELDDSLVGELVKTPFNDAIPLSILNKFPNFSIYVKCNIPELLPSQYSAGRFLGFFCGMMTRTMSTDSTNNLVFLMHYAPPEEFPTHLYRDSAFLEPCILPFYGSLSVQDHLKASIDSHKGTVLKRFGDLSLNESDIRNIKNIEKLINIILYLCSTNLDVIDKSPSVKRHPFKAVLGKNALGKFQIFPALKPKIICVGDSIGSELREFDRFSKASTNPIRPHVRRAHWHGFWTGPRLGEREFILKWIPPTMVGVHNGYVDRAVI